MLDFPHHVYHRVIWYIILRFGVINKPFGPDIMPGLDNAQRQFQWLIHGQGRQTTELLTYLRDYELFGRRTVTFECIMDSPEPFFRSPVSSCGSSARMTTPTVTSSNSATLSAVTGSS